MMTKEQTWARLAQLAGVAGEIPKNRWNLSRTNLSGANLSRTNLSEANLSEANLSEADLSGANLREAHLMGAHLMGANLREAHLMEAHLIGAHLGEANLSGANISEADLREADLSEADLRKANLIGANLIGAHLRQANISEADLRKADLSEADLRKADLFVANLIGANLTGADLTGADLTGADLTDADLTGANLTDATLTASVLIKTDLTKANLSGACIDNANISEWVIKDVTCSHTIQAKSGKQIRIGFEPLEFEKKYAHIGKIAELILSIPLTESTGFIANAIAQSINHIKKLSVISWKGVEALSNGDTKITFTIFDSDFYQHQKETFETVLKKALNDYFRNNPPEDARDQHLDQVRDATGQVITIKKAIPVPLIPLEINALALEKKGSGFFLRMGKTGEDILRIATSVFR